MKLLSDTSRFLSPFIRTFWKIKSRNNHYSPVIDHNESLTLTKNLSYVAESCNLDPSRSNLKTANYDPKTAKVGHFGQGKGYYYYEKDRRYWDDNEEERGNTYYSSSNSDSRTPLLMGAAGVLAWIKSSLGLDENEGVVLDEDPIKDKIKQSHLYRKYGKYENAVRVLHEALAEIEKQDIKDYPEKEMVITRVYSEIGNTYMDIGQLVEADALFRTVLSRLLYVHKRMDDDPEFIGISLKLADIFAQKKDFETAEAGFAHCLEKQQAKLYSLESDSKTDPEDLKESKLMLAVILETFATFLLSTYSPKGKEVSFSFGGSSSSSLLKPEDSTGKTKTQESKAKESRLAKSEEYIQMAISIVSHYYGMEHPNTIIILNNFGIKAIHTKQFKLAEKYLSKALKLADKVSSMHELLPAYYSNYGEAIFHLGMVGKALEMIRKGHSLAKRNKEREDVLLHCEIVLNAVEDELKNSTDSEKHNV